MNNLQGAGLENLGNTCFLNSVLQCLTYTEPLATYLHTGKHQTTCRTAGFCALCAIQRHVTRALQSTGRILAPKDLVSNLRCISRSFRNARQEDAHEYMVNLLESMHKCCLPSGVPSESPSAYEKSLVHKIFGGRLRSQVKCMQCSFCSNKFDPFLDLSLEIVKADSLHKALAHFTAKEQLDGGARQYQCQQCKQKVKALKQLTIHKAPYVLTIHLKRFGSQITGQKIDKQIQFGPTLNLKPFVTGPYDEDLKYTLYGVLVHAGWSTHSGHYYCFVRTSSGMWYSLDDNRVVQVNERKVLEQKAYMLFYFRDRKTSASKKPSDDVQKQSMALNAMGNKPSFSCNQGSKETVQNGPFENTLNALNSFAAQRGVLNAPASKEAPRKVISSKKNNGPTMAVWSSLNSDSLPKVPPLKDSMKGLSVPNLDGGEGLPRSISAVEGFDDKYKLDSAMITTAGAKITGCYVERNKEKDLSDPVAVPANCNGIQTSVANKVLGDSVTIQSICNKDKIIKEDLRDTVTMPPNCNLPHISPINGGITENASSWKNDNKAALLDPNEKASKYIDSVRLSNHTSREDDAIGGFSKESDGSNSLHDKAGDIGRRVVRTESSYSSRLPITALDSKPRQKLRRKLLMSQIRSMRLGSSLLFGTSLSLPKKKKHKRSKQRSSQIKNLSKEQLLDREGITMDLGPSTSEKIKTIPLGGSAQSQQKGVKSRTHKKNKSVVAKDVTNTNSNLCSSTIDEKFKERICQNDAVLASNVEPKKSSSAASAVNHSDARIPYSSKDSGRQLMQKDLMNILTRGLEETIVGRWDEMELPSSQIPEPSGVESVSIGYVADEWDEEYDRGKRKKVRIFKHDFGGPNPFQEIATKKAKLGKTKRDQSSSGNQPFRI
ncbi:unnamed protein product [Ilex paraguariensis]|uniref:Ubiquitin carboxyl-terminal hydrolase n=1 Tax=Ilex paraguariensis TaxID=185542 RepID=A0ABC8SM18_9AQUA